MVKERPLYKQIKGGGPDAQNYLYFDFIKEAYVVGELRENLHFIYEFDGNRHVFTEMRNKNTEI